MARYHFDIIDGFEIKDPLGMECSEPQAIKLAHNIARQIAEEVGPNSARKVVVVDDDAQKLHEVAIADPK